MFQVERQQDRELESLLVQYGEKEGVGSPPCPLLMCFIQSGRRKTKLMFQVERQQDRELESLLVQYGEEEGERSPPCPLLMCYI
jgi:hypothetical protein